jgi:hypothetical protein
VAIAEQQREDESRTNDLEDRKQEATQIDGDRKKPRGWEKKKEIEEGDERLSRGILWLCAWIKNMKITIGRGNWKSERNVNRPELRPTKTSGKQKDWKS